MNTTTQVKAKKRTTSRTDQSEGLDSVTKYSISVMGGVSALVGIWAATCIISALIGSSGPLELVQNWFGTVTGK